MECRLISIRTIEEGKTYSEKRTYDENGNNVLTETSKKEKIIQEFNKNNNLIHYLLECPASEGEGREYWNTYNDKNQLIETIDSNGTKSNFEYDKNGDCILTKINCDGVISEEKYEYDKNHNILHYITDNEERICEYDDNDNEIYYKSLNIDNTGHKTIIFEEHNTYDEKGRTISKISNKLEIHYEYNDSTKTCHTIASNRNEEWLTFDDYGNIIYMKDDNDNERWFEYEYIGKCVIAKDGEDITIDSPEYLLDDNYQIIIFDNKDNAIEFLKEEGIINLEGYHFLDYEKFEKGINVDI